MIGVFGKQPHLETLKLILIGVFGKLPHFATLKLTLIDVFSQDNKSQCEDTNYKH